MDIINTYISKGIKETITIFSKFGTNQIFILFILLSHIFHEEILRNQLILGLIIMTTIAMPIRYFLFKERPKSIKYNNFLEKIKASAFPSMHTARFGFITIILYLFTKNIELAIILFTIFLTIIIQRIQSKKHDIYDIIGGLILAIATIIIITNINIF